MEIKDIQNLIKFVAKSGANEVKLETDEFKITIRTGMESKSPEATYIQQIPAAPIATAPVAAAPAAPVEAAAPPTEAAPITQWVETQGIVSSYHYEANVDGLESDGDPETFLRCQQQGAIRNE